MGCNHDCGSCGESCAERKITTEKPHEGSNIKHVIAVVSGKGGVGKSLVTSLCAVAAERAGYKTAVLDADVTGPSIPRLFGIRGMAEATELGLMPRLSKHGARVMSLNLLLEEETEPVVWRGPVIAGAVKQFWTDVVWGDVDFMFVDMPPGTGDVPLTVFQSLPVDGIIIVTSPQELVSMIVEKAVRMAKLMNIPVLGLVENMSYIECPDCGKKIDVFGASKLDDAAGRYGVKPILRIPVNPEIARKCDCGKVEEIDEVDLSPVTVLLKEVAAKK